jgi:hypothetical protein
MTSLFRTKSDEKMSSIDSSLTRADDSELDLASARISRISFTSTLTDDYSFEDSLAAEQKQGNNSASRMERIADHHDLNKSSPTMPRRIDSVRGGPSETSTHTASSEAQSRGAHSKNSSSHDSMPACSHHSSMPVPVSSELLRRGGSAFNVDADPAPKAPQRLASIHQPSNHTTRSAPASPERDMNQYRRIRLPPTPKKSEENAFHRLPLKRVARSRREHAIDVKPLAPNSISISGSSSVTSTSPKQTQQRPAVLRTVSARRDPRRENIFGPLHIPKRHQSVKNPDDGHGHGHGLGLSPPREPQRKSALVVKQRDSYKAPPYGDNDYLHQEEQEEQGCIMIEVTPGADKLPLRGGAETWRAIEEGSITVTMCGYCKMDLNCVFDAQLVICPDCFILSPVDQTEQGTADSTTSMHRRGVGVGIKAEEIRRWVMSNSE